MTWYNEPAVSALQYDKYAGLSSVRVFDGSSLGYTEVKLEEEQIEWNDSHITAAARAQHDQHQPHYHSPHSTHQHNTAAQTTPAPHLSAAAASSSNKLHSSPIDEHKAAASNGPQYGAESGLSGLLTRRVNRNAVNGVSGYSPPLSAISHRSLSPSASSDRDSEEQMVM